MTQSRNRVGINWQTLLIFIPCLNIWASWRIQRLRRSLLFFIPVFIAETIFFRLIIAYSESIENVLTQYLLALVTFGFFIIGANFIIHYFRKWSRKWNEEVKIWKEK